MRTLDLILDCFESPNSKPPIAVGWRTINNCVDIHSRIILSKSAEPPVADTIFVEGDGDGGVHVVPASRVHRVLALKPLIARELVLPNQLRIAKPQLVRILLPLQHIQIAKEREEWSGRVKSISQFYIFTVCEDSKRNVVAENLFPLVISTNPWTVNLHVYMQSSSLSTYRILTVVEMHQHFCIRLFPCVIHVHLHLLRHDLHQVLVAHGPELGLCEQGAVQGLVDGGQPTEAALLRGDLPETEVHLGVHTAVQLSVQSLHQQCLFALLLLESIELVQKSRLISSPLFEAHPM